MRHLLRFSYPFYDARMSMDSSRISLTEDIVNGECSGEDDEVPGRFRTKRLRIGSNASRP